MARSRPQRVAELGDAAIRILAARGRHALTHRAVDAEAGLPAGSTSYYARTRDALLALVVDRIAELDADAGVAAAAAAVTPTGAPAATLAEAPGSPAAARGRRPATAAAPNVHAVAEMVAGLVHTQLGRDRARTLARFELSLEAVHSPALRATLNRAGQRFRERAADLLAALGSTEPARHGRLLVAVCDGILFDALAGAGNARPPTRREIRDGIEEVLRGLLASSA